MDVRALDVDRGRGVDPGGRVEVLDAQRLGAPAHLGEHAQAAARAARLHRSSVPGPDFEREVAALLAAALGAGLRAEATAGADGRRQGQERRRECDCGERAAHPILRRSIRR